MSDNISSNNLAIVSGTILPDFRPCPGKYGNNFCMMDLAVQRLSGHMDYIPATIHKTLAPEMQSGIGQNILVFGRFSSYNYSDAAGRHLILSLLVDKYMFASGDAKNENVLFLDGYTTKPAILRKTPLGRTIADLHVAINYPNGSSDYLPCICWNDNAHTASMFPCGTHIYVWGRIQSREYQKKIDELRAVTKTAYEVSIFKMSKADAIN